MKILYGVQGTGNGHISRARAMAESFENYPEVTVDWLFSGRTPENYFDMACFGDYQAYQGLTFVYKQGVVKKLDTLFNAAPRKLLTDIRELDLSSYDLVITDFEPISAWAAKKQGVESLGIGHQYAFAHSIPIWGSNITSKALMRYMAPTDRSVGLHWHHFNGPILPPIIAHKTASTHKQVEKDSVLVYLPFEDSETIISLLRRFPDYQFTVYGPDLQDADFDNIQTRKPNRAGFMHDLHRCYRVICNSGFELISEALSIGKAILTRPLEGQMEQMSNAAALAQLDLAHVYLDINSATLGEWLSQPPVMRKLRYPDVAAALARWICGGQMESVEQLASNLWSQVDSPLQSFKLQTRVPGPLREGTSSANVRRNSLCAQNQSV